jgi:hypothetical protein
MPNAQSRIIGPDDFFPLDADDSFCICVGQKVVVFKIVSDANATGVKLQKKNDKQFVRLSIEDPPSAADDDKETELNRLLRKAGGDDFVDRVIREERILDAGFEIPQERISKDIF